MTKQIYPLVAGALPTLMTTSFNPSTDTQFTVESMEWIPTTSNHLTIRSNPHFVTILFTSISGNTIQGVSYVEGESNYTFPIGSTVMRTIDKYDFDAFDENKLDVYQGTANVGKYMKVGADGNLYPAVGGGGGTTDYNSLDNKPSINSTTLTGDKTSAQLGLASATDLTNKLNKNLGTSEYGKFLVINSSGEVITVHPAVSGETLYL